MGKRLPKWPTTFLVVRQALGVRAHFGLEFAAVHGSYDDRPRDVPVRAFATRKRAEAFARELDAELRATFPMPLLMEAMGEFVELTHWLPRFLSEQGLPPIEFSKERYPNAKKFRSWWAKHAGELSAEQRAALWQPFAGRRFHCVREIELEG
jgi:hypothetical protein